MEARPKATSRYAFMSFCLFVAAALAACCISAPNAAYADEDTQNLNPEYVEALGRLNALTDEYNALANQQNETYEQLQDVRSKIDDNEKKIADVKKEIESRKAELAKKQQALADFVASDYKAGNVSLLSILLSASSFEDAISKVYYHDAICQDQATRIEEVNVAKAKLQSEQDELNKLKDDLDKREADIEGLYQQQSAQADQMYAQQMEAAELLVSLPKEIQEDLGEDSAELINESKAAIEAQEETSQQEGSSSQDTKQTSGSSNSNSDSSSNKSTTSSGSSSSSTGSSTSSGGSKTTQTGSSGTMQAVLDAAYSTSGTEALNNGWGCAGWVYCVFRNSGVYNRKPTCAAWYYNNWCYTSDRSQIQPGMVVAVSTWTGTSAGKIYGHVGIYVGNNTVRHLSSGSVREISLDKWISRYGTTVTPMWGWNGGIVLS